MNGVLTTIGERLAHFAFFVFFVEHVLNLLQHELVQLNKTLLFVDEGLLFRD